MARNKSEHVGLYMTEKQKIFLQKRAFTERKTMSVILLELLQKEITADLEIEIKRGLAKKT